MQDYAPAVDIKRSRDDIKNGVVTPCPVAKTRLIAAYFVNKTMQKSCMRNSS